MSNGYNLAPIFTPAMYPNINIKIQSVPKLLMLEQSMGARNRVGIGLSYRPTRLPQAGVNDSLKLIPGLNKSFKKPPLYKSPQHCEKQSLEHTYPRATSIREKYRLHLIWTSHIRRWQISAESILACAVYRVQSTPLSHINRFTDTPWADYSKPHSDNFGNFLRRLAFALASTFLYGWKDIRRLTAPLPFPPWTQLALRQMGSTCNRSRWE